MWFEALRTDVQVRRARGASIQEVLRVKKDYLASSMKNLESMIECQVCPFACACIAGLTARPQVFRSATVTQMKTIYDLMDFEEVCTRSEHSIRQTLREKSQRVYKSRKYDSMYRAWNCFMKIWEDMNKYFTLNAGNLAIALEVYLSKLMFKFAHTNDTW
jgi:hypothetical protein